MTIDPIDYIQDYDAQHWEIKENAFKVAVCGEVNDLETAQAALNTLVTNWALEGEIALASGKILIGSVGGKAVAQTLTGDVTVTTGGVTAVGAGKVTAAMLANGAGLAALIAAGLGASAAYPKTTNGVQTPLAANPAARVVLIICVVTEVFANGNGAQPVFAIGETDTTNKFTNGSAFTNATLNAVKVFAGTLTATKALIVTATAATGTGTGALSFTTLVLPAAI